MKESDTLTNEVYIDGMEKYRQGSAVANQLVNSNYSQFMKDSWKWLSSLHIEAVLLDNIDDENENEIDAGKYFIAFSTLPMSDDILKWRRSSSKYRPLGIVSSTNSAMLVDVISNLSSLCQDCLELVGDKPDGITRPSPSVSFMSIRLLILSLTEAIVSATIVINQPTAMISHLFQSIEKISVTTTNDTIGNPPMSHAGLFHEISHKIMLRLLERVLTQVTDDCLRITLGTTSTSTASNKGYKPSHQSIDVNNIRAIRLAQDADLWEKFLIWTRDPRFECSRQSQTTSIDKLQTVHQSITVDFQHLSSMLYYGDVNVAEFNGLFKYQHELDDIWKLIELPTEVESMSCNLEFCRQNEWLGDNVSEIVDCNLDKSNMSESSTFRMGILPIHQQW